MKKITLMMLLALGLNNAGHGQATYTIVAPDDLGATSSLRAPNGTSVHAYQRSVMYIHPYEMLPMNSSSITSVGFQYLQGTGSAPVIGNFTLYLQNLFKYSYQNTKKKFYFEFKPKFKDSDSWKESVSVSGKKIKLDQIKSDFFGVILIELLLS